MIKSEIREITVQKEVILEVICNKCGYKEKFIECQNGYFQAITLNFGYVSKFDGELWEFHLCENCLVEFIKTFKYAPSGFGRDGYGDNETIEEQQYYFEYWKKNSL